jgi:hypothetical protein
VTSDGPHGSLDVSASELEAAFTSMIKGTVTAEATHPPGTVVDDDGNPVSDEDD